MKPARRIMKVLSFGWTFRKQGWKKPLLKAGIWPVLISPCLGAQMAGAGIGVEGANCPGDWSAPWNTPFNGKRALEAKLFWGETMGFLKQLSRCWGLWGCWKLSWVNVTSRRTQNENFSLPHITRVRTRLQMSAPLSWRREKGNWAIKLVSFLFTGSGLKPFKWNWSSLMVLQETEMELVKLDWLNRKLCLKGLNKTSGW